MPFDSVPDVLNELRAGRCIVLTESRGPGSHGDVMCAAEKVTPETINFMASQARGLIRLSLPADKCEHLQLEVQARDASQPLQKAFTISIDARDLEGSGISARNRAKTILSAIRDDCQPSDLVRPGHILPLRARPGGVLVRAGRTEGSVDLARQAGLSPAGVFCEVLGDDGEPMILAQLSEFSSNHGLRMCAVPDIIEFRLKTEQIERVADVQMPTQYGDFRLIAYRAMGNPEPHVALTKGGIGLLDQHGNVAFQPAPVLVRVQPECLPGCAVGSDLCDCGRAMAMAMNRIEEEGRGALVLLRRNQSTRIEDAIHPHALAPDNRKKSPVFSAVSQAGRRDFGLGSQILRALGLRKLRVLTDSLRTIHGLEGFGLTITERLPLR